MKRYPVIMGAIFIIAMAVIAYTLKDIVREWILIPSLQLVQLINDLPQLFIWVLFMIIVFSIAYASLNIGKLSILKTPKAERITPKGHIGKLAEMVKRADNEKLARYQLLKYLGDLCIEILAFKEKTATDEIKKKVRSGTIILPEDIASSLKTLFPDNLNSYGKDGEMWSDYRESVESLNIDISYLLGFLREQLEVFNGTNDQ